MTQPAQQPQTAPPAAPAAPQGQPAQQLPSLPPAQPAPYTAPPQAPGYAPQAAPLQQPQPAAPAWLQQPQAPGQPPAQPAPQQQPYPQAQPGQGYPMLPAAYPPPPAPVDGGDDGQGYDLTRLPKGAREEIERLRTQAQQHTVQLRTASVSQQAWALAPQMGVNPQALVGSLAWQQAAAQLDPSAPDYAQRLPWTIQGVLAANPWMAAPASPASQPAPGQPGAPASQPQPAPPTPPQPAGPARSGGDFTGGPAGGATQHVGTGVDRLRHAYSQT